MPTAADSLVDEALKLPAEARISLVDRILESLNLPTRPDINRFWAEEAERRVAEIDGGEVELIPGEDVFAKIRRKYSRGDFTSPLGRTQSSMKPRSTTRTVRSASVSSPRKKYTTRSDGFPSIRTPGP